MVESCPVTPCCTCVALAAQKLVSLPGVLEQDVQVMESTLRMSSQDGRISREAMRNVLRRATSARVSAHLTLACTLQ